MAFQTSGKFRNLFYYKKIKVHFISVIFSIAPNDYICEGLINDV